LVKKIIEKSFVEERIETLDSKKLIRPGRPNCSMVSACREVIEGKIYIIGVFPDKKTFLRNELWVYDLGKMVIFV